jgi:methionyl aminopeptidase
LKNGDVLKIDCGITYQKCVADAAITLVVGGDHTNPDGAHLIQVTKDALNAGLATLQPGSTLREFGETVYQHVRAHDCHIIKHLTGHGVGVQVHESPSVYNRPHPSLSKITLQPGMVLALEPITSQHSVDFVAHPGNDRNLYTEFGDLGAQREYTIAVHEESIEVLAGMRE